jgi:hypothetical protein
VKLFFQPGAGEKLLIAADDTIFKSSEVANRAKQILQKLQEGPHQDGLFPSLPKDTKVQDVFISAEGTAFVNFSNTISTNHPGGVLDELATIYSIVDSLTYKRPGNQGSEDPDRRHRKRNPCRTLFASSPSPNGSLDDQCDASRRNNLVQRSFSPMRSEGRANNQMRTVRMTPGFISQAEGSVLIEVEGRGSSVPLSRRNSAAVP